jgi:hypothetical protein
VGIEVFNPADSGIVNPGFCCLFLEENQVERLLESLGLSLGLEQVLDFFDFRFV